jgi:hypothetical protein
VDMLGSSIALPPDTVTELRLMNGGRVKWLAEGREVRSAPASQPATAYRFPDGAREDIRAYRDTVLARLGDVSLVDVPAESWTLPYTPSTSGKLARAADPGSLPRPRQPQSATRQASGEADAARQLLEDTLPRQQRVLGADHLETGQTGDVLARARPYSARE